MVVQHGVPTGHPQAARGECVVGNVVRGVAVRWAAWSNLTNIASLSGARSVRAERGRFVGGARAQVEQAVGQGDGGL